MKQNFSQQLHFLGFLEDSFQILALLTIFVQLLFLIRKREEKKKREKNTSLLILLAHVSFKEGHI